MKISKVFAGMSAMALAATMSITAFAGAGIVGTCPDDGWQGAGSGLAKRILIGQESDTPMFPEADRAKMADIATVKITISGDNFGADDWGTSGSIVVTSTAASWDQHDFKLGTAATLEDGSVDPEANAGLDITDNGDGSFTIAYTDAAGLYKNDDISNEGSYYGIVVQNFDENGATWNITSMELLDASGNAVEPGAAGGTTTTTTAASDDTTTTTTTTTTAATTTKKSGTSTTTSTAASDNTAATGATAGIALAGLAIAGAAVVISKKK